MYLLIEVPAAGMDCLDCLFESTTVEEGIAIGWCEAFQQMTELGKRCERCLASEVEEVSTEAL
ncbi:hypothetical protein GSbR_41960 [Geobacter sp. SVR]|nr:hypothetical protein GSVR_24200 [Geobacter sp. SVR]GCF87596.1 hypothetical protein GSbR_41960 [Geobacter sp. SVR]